MPDWLPTALGSPIIISRLTAIKSLLDLGNFELVAVASSRLEGDRGQQEIDDVLSALEDHRYSDAAHLIEKLLSDGTRFSLHGMVRVAGGRLPASSKLCSQSVDTFFIGKTQVTWSEWQTVRTWALANGYDLDKVGKGEGPHHPVTNVSWYQSLKWCNARSEKEGLSPVYGVGAGVYRSGDAVPTVDTAANGYRLPSEKEWEFAARGGVKSCGYVYSGGLNINSVAWYSANSGHKIHEVATKQANELGLFDMSGNVWEWCFVDSDDEDSDWVGRAGRGGSWGNDQDRCHVAARNYNDPGDTYFHFGFRIARSSVP